MAGRGRGWERQVNSTQRQTSARLHLRGSKGRLGQSRDPGDFRLLFFTMRLSGSEAYRGYISTSSSVYTGGRANQGTSISAVELGECGTTWLSANFISPVLLFSLGQVEVWTTAEYRCVRLGSRSATEARWCSPTAAARWKDVPEERMWQQEVLILPAPACSMPLPARNLAGNPLRPQRKSTESQPRKSCVCPQEIHTKSV